MQCFFVSLLVWTDLLSVIRFAFPLLVRTGLSFYPAPAFKLQWFITPSMCFLFPYSLIYNRESKVNMALRKWNSLRIGIWLPLVLINIFNAAHGTLINRASWRLVSSNKRFVSLTSPTPRAASSHPGSIRVFLSLEHTACTVFIDVCCSDVYLTAGCNFCPGEAPVNSRILLQGTMTMLGEHPLIDKHLTPSLKLTPGQRKICLGR